ncbi:MAG TPA: phosphatase PAP2 family protein [Candidatus Acidoferrum sp.]|nr:phosphatase PAP2 family protein [Candidatus Acidoferrum sp.]
MSSLLTLDRKLTQIIAGRPKAAQPYVAAFSWLGAPEVLLPVCLLLGAWQLAFGNRWLGLALWLAIGASFAGLGLSFIIRRPRPKSPYADHMPFKSYSFPSVHALGTIVLSGLALYFLDGRLQAAQWWVAAACLTVFVLLIGYSRVYLGAHFVLDVLAGWTCGAIAAAVIIVMVQYAARLG